MPGQSIRFPVEDKGRFEPLDLEKWLSQYTISPPEIDLDETGVGVKIKN